MKVLVCTPSFFPNSDGISNSVSFHVRVLVEGGHDVTVVTGLPKIEGFDDFVTVHRLDIAGRLYGAHFFLVGETRRYQEILQHGRWNLVLIYCWQHWTSDLFFKVQGSVRAPVVFVSHGVSVRSVDWASFRSVLRYIVYFPYRTFTLPRQVKRLRHIVFLSERADKDRFYDVFLFRRSGRTPCVIPNVVASPVGRGSASCPRHRSERPYLLCVGAFTDGKNQKDLIRAFSRSGLKKDYDLILCGQYDTPYLAALRSFSDKIGLKREVKYVVGSTGSALEQYYRGARLFVSMSRTECQPMVLLECLSFGLPFLSTDVGCVSDFQGGVVAGNDVDVFAAKLRCLSMDEDNLARLSRAGLRYIAEHHSESVVRGKFESLIASYSASL